MIFLELLGPELGLLIGLALWVYCIFDVISTDEALIRNMPKGIWLMIVIFLPDIGSLAWLFLGRPANAGWRPGDTSVRQPKRALSPEDDPGWSPRRATPPPPATATDADRLKAWEDDLARREAELRKQEPDDPDDGDFTFRW
jgi:hypothetical protein